MTAPAFEEERRHILAAGCDDFIRKPFENKTIFDAIASHLGIKYAYQIQEPGESPPADGTRLTNFLASVPESLLRDLESAALDLNLEEIHRCLDAIGKDHPGEVESLIRLAEQFRFEEILNHIRRK